MHNARAPSSCIDASTLCIPPCSTCMHPPPTHPLTPLHPHPTPPHPRPPLSCRVCLGRSLFPLAPCSDLSQSPQCCCTGGHRPAGQSVLGSSAQQQLASDRRWRAPQALAAPLLAPPAPADPRQVQEPRERLLTRHCQLFVCLCLLIARQRCASVGSAGAGTSAAHHSLPDTALLSHCICTAPCLHYVIEWSKTGGRWMGAGRASSGATSGAARPCQRVGQLSSRGAARRGALILCILRIVLAQFKNLRPLQTCIAPTMSELSERSVAARSRPASGLIRPAGHGGRQRVKAAPSADDSLPPAAAEALQAPLETPHHIPAHPLVQQTPPGLPAAVAAPTGLEREVQPGIYEAWWSWGGRRIRYLRSGAGGAGAGPPLATVVCVHGFCASASHWEAALGYLAAHGCRAYALDLLGGCAGMLPRCCGMGRRWAGAAGAAGAAPHCATERRPLQLQKHLIATATHLSAHPPTHGPHPSPWPALPPLPGFGWSDKPDPRCAAPNGRLYCFATWARQLRAFIHQVVGGGPVLLVCNSGEARGLAWPLRAGGLPRASGGAGLACAVAHVPMADAGLPRMPLFLPQRAVRWACRRRSMSRSLSWGCR